LIDMGWTDERVDTLKKLWLDGLSASQIAKQLGGVTRNAVIGKVHRLGLSGRAAPSQPARPVFKAPRPARPAATAIPITRRAAPVVEPTSPIAVEPAPQPGVMVATAATAVLRRAEEPGVATVLTLGAHMCKWPIGDPSSDEFTFCGRRSADEGPYCIEHARVAYQPHQIKKKAGATELARSLRRYV
jgi:GcrA cell cycle regulator